MILVIKRTISGFGKVMTILAIAAFVFASCSKPSVNQPIFDRAYALCQDGEYSMSEEYLNNHQSELVQPLSEADSVYLIFLKSMYKAKLALLDYGGIADTTQLNRCIDFYTKTADTEKLAWSLIMKTLKFSYLGNNPQAVLFLRQAEDIANPLTNSELKFYLAYLRFEFDGSTFDLGERGLGLIEKMRPYARSIEQKAYYLSAKVSVFYFNDLIDSTKMYVREFEKIDTTTYSFLSIYGMAFADEEPEKSLRYALKAAEINPWNDVAKLSRIKSYLYLNRLQDALDFYQKSTFLGDGTRFIALEDFYNYYHNHNMAAEADKIAAELITIYHALLKSVNESVRILSASTNYDFEIQELANQNRTQRIIFVAVLLFVIVITLLSAVLVRQRRRHENELARNRQILKESHDKIEELMAQNESADNKREIARLQRKIAEIEGQYAEIYSDGKRLYEAVFANGGHSGQWNKKDYEKFIEYYKTIDFSLIAQIEDDYKGLNPRQLFYKILVCKGFDKEQVMRTMGIQEDGTYRALKSKVEGARKPTLSND
ncbi:MAG: hypothetical protein IKW86_12730 [Salinivirgaceae bacterium]|nr:hypothetical protein [Salinivirgaceae bacterium]